MSDAGYALLDSGAGEKLEQFGPVSLVRPSSLSIWKRRLPSTDWDSAHGRFVHQDGWEERRGEIAPWQISILDLKLTLELQKNGQLGLFPEHLPLIESIEATVRMRGRDTRVLNLFGYTGLATLAAVRAGAIVTHVDISKRCLDWARENIELNSLPLNRVRLIPEDAIAFVERELRRNSTYDVIIADPPSFSRLSRSKSWDFEDVIAPLIEMAVKLAQPRAGLVAISSHHLELGAHSLRNLLADADTGQGELSGDILPIYEQTGVRALPAACYAMIQLG